MKIQITKDITFPNSTIIAIKQGTVLTLPYRKDGKSHTIIMEFQDRSFFFNNYVSLYCIDGSETFGIPLQEHKHFQILNKERGKIIKLTQTEFELEEDIQILLF
jgi:hypothetical protein